MEISISLNHLINFHMNLDAFLIKECNNNAITSIDNWVLTCNRVAKVANVWMCVHRVV